MAAVGISSARVALGRAPCKTVKGNKARMMTVFYKGYARLGAVHI